MSENQIVVPGGMLEAVNSASKTAQIITDERLLEMLEPAIRWLSENPIVPTVEQSSDMMEKFPVNTSRNVCVEWQRRMFLARDPDYPILDLLQPNFFNAVQIVTGEVPTRHEQQYADAVREAYRRGQESKQESENHANR